MAKRGYKLQEFVAHPTNVNCLSIGKKTSRLLITGGDDHKVNLWAIGKPNSLRSLCGHTSPVESVAFNSAEVSVVAGSSSGVIKLWDLEEAKMVRTLTGHRSNSTAVDFHPFGEFLASGSMDTNLKIWDIRKKGCIHTYKGHTRGINTIRFTPDGRWVVSGGLDNVVKVWDLTAGKILHEFKFHEGHIRTLDFHPLEFLLATGSADGTVKFWDLETFELIGSSRPESSGVRAITFHPDGRTLFCGSDDSLKVYSWEPVICHDSVDMGWSTLGDLCINEGKLLSCSYYSNSVGVWVSDISLIEPYGAGLNDKHKYTEKMFTSSRSQSSERIGNDSKPQPPSIVRSMSLDFETKEIKNIYIDSPAANLTAAQKVVFPLDSEKVKNVTSEKQNSSDLGREPVTFSRTKPGMLLRPAHLRKTPTKFDEAKRPPARSRTPSRGKSGSDSEKEQCDEEYSTIKSITDRFERALSSEPPSNRINCEVMLSKPPHAPRTPDTKIKEARSVSVDSGFKSKKKGAGYLSDQELRDELISEDVNIKSSKSKFERSPSPQAPYDLPARVETINRSSESSPVKVVRGVAVVSGRTRSLVNRFERREGISSNEDKLVTVTVSQSPNVTAVESDVLAPQSGNAIPIQVVPIVPVVINQATEHKRVTGVGAKTVGVSTNQPTNAMTNESQVTPFQPSNTVSREATSVTVAQVNDTKNNKRFSGFGDKTLNVTTDQPTNVMADESQVSPPKPGYTVPSRVKPVTRNMRKHERFNGTGDNMFSEAISQPTNAVIDEPRVIPPRPVDSIPIEKEEPEISGRVSETDITENLMQTHEAFLSTLQSRLMKLQIVRHFWERNDIKGAIGALKKLPDHSVQADVIGVLMEKTKILTLDLFSSLLPVLTDLLRSKTERPANVSLEMLLKLVATFGTVINSTVSAPQVVGVDLHAEQRLQLCNECFVGLQNIKKILPELARRGGVNARKAQELNLVLQGPY